MRGSVLCLALLLAGCLELEQEVVIGPDGKGTQTLRLDMSKALLARLQKQSLAANPMLPLASRDFAAIFDRKKAGAELGQAGLELVAFDASETRGRRKVALTSRFDSLAELSHSPLLGGKADWIIKPAGKGQARLFFYPMGREAWQDAQLRLKAFKTRPDDPRAKAWFQRLRGQLDGLHLRFKIKLPGVALRSDNRWGKLSRGAQLDEVVAEIKAADIQRVEDLLRVLAPVFIVVFDARKCRFGKRR